MKTIKKHPSSADEIQKLRKNAHRRSTTGRNCRKTLIVGRRQAEIAEKRSSSVDETRKTIKTTHRRSTKYRNHQKTSIVGRRNAGLTENHSSSVDESGKMAKIICHPWMKMQKNIENRPSSIWLKVRKCRKTAFRHGGRVKNSKNIISAAAEK